MILFLKILSGIFLFSGLFALAGNTGMTDFRKKATSNQVPIIVAHDVVGGIGGIVLIILAVHILLHLA